MHIEQIYTGCLAQGSYYIESDGEVAIIDPLREVKNYITKAEAANANIKYIFETHFHADFVSGHVTLAEQTGAEIIYGPHANPSFKSIIAQDNQIFKLGNCTIQVLHTPGHTMESSCFLVSDENGVQKALFSGDTLFIGDVGRPDLAQKAASMTQEDLAGILFESLRSKIMTLPDDVLVYPGHGAGSACGKNMSKETVGTIGQQKIENYALRENMTKSEFIREVTDGLLPPPSYFPLNVKLNKEGYESIDTVIERGIKALTPVEFEMLVTNSDALMLDVRNQADFIEAHIPNAIFIGIDGGFAPWVGALIQDVKQKLVLICPEGREEEVITRLARVGFDQTLGFLAGGMDAWKKAGKETDTLESVSAVKFEENWKENHYPIFDVRKPGEFDSAHLKEAKSTPLDFINEHLSEFPKEKPFYIHCAGGYRSVIAASILKSRGFHNMIDVAGGFGAIKNGKLEICETTCSKA